jgi:16S rRNA (uracil1498-N3)-methyltransferase
MQMAVTPKTRLFSSHTLVGGSDLWLTGEQAKYVSRVLRLKVDHKLVMFDGTGGQYPAAIKDLAKDRILLSIGEHRGEELESPLAVHLVQGLSRGGRMDVVMQKATELGVRRVTPVITEFSVVRLDSGRAARRHEHWSKISQSACEQCGRNTLPRIDVAQEFDAWLAARSGDGTTRIVLDPRCNKAVSALPAPHTAIELLIGPEGGLSDAEYRRCNEAGFEAVALGPRILRTETAAIAAIAVIQALWGDLG